MFPNGASLPAELGNVPLQNTDVLNQGPGSLSAMPSDMLPMDLDMPLDNDAQNDLSSFSAGPMQNGPGTPLTPSDAFVLLAGNSGLGNLTGGGLSSGLGSAHGSGSGSTLTEFTKRRNWSQRVLEELKDFMHILTPEGRILYVSPSCNSLTGYGPGQILGRFFTDFLHQDDSGLFIREFNESIASNHPLRMFLRFRKDDNQYAIFEAHGHPHLSSEAMNYPPNSGQTFCRGFFMMARPYPTKNASLLDSFLEHKIENERLMKRIADLKREEQEEQENQDQQWSQRKDAQSTTASSASMINNKPIQESSIQYNGMPPPAKPDVSSIALTRQNLDEALAASKPDSINDKMARYEGASHIDTIEMLTGLQYRNGERSQGISTGHQSPALIRGDAGIPIQIDKDSRSSSDKKKKVKLPDEYVCTDCGTLDSPEWRKGPNGPKTLCNACGLRWAKREKKRQSIVANNNNHAGAMPGANGVGM